VVFEYLMITVLLLNTFFLLVTTQVQSNGRRVMTHKEIRSHYCKNELLIDLVSTVSECSASVRSPVGARWSYFGSYAPSRWPIRRLPRVHTAHACPAVRRRPSAKGTLFSGALGAAVRAGLLTGPAAEQSDPVPSVSAVPVQMWQG